MNTFNRGLVSSIVATFLVAVLVTGAPLASGTGAPFSGRVFDEQRAPREGVVVTLLDEPTGRMHVSTPTGAEGAFRIVDVPAGEYTLVAETGEGAFLAPASVTVNSDANAPLALTLNLTAPDYAPAGQSSSGSTAGNKGGWSRWVIAGAIGVVGLFLIYEVTKDSEQDASQY